MSAVMEQWYYMRGGERVGPVTQGELCALFEGRALGLETLVWGEAFRRWVPASMIAGFRELCGQEGERGPGTGGVLDCPSGQNEPMAFGGWLLLVAVGRVIGPPACLLWAAICWLGADVLARRGQIPSATPFQVVAIVMAVMGVYELGTSLLFFAKKRAAVPAMIGEYVLGVLFMVMATWLGWGRRPGVLEEERWLTGVGPAVIGAVVWIWYLLASRRVKATFVR